MIVEYIDEHKDQFGVEPISKDLQVAPSTYGAAKTRAPSARSLTDATTTQHVETGRAAMTSMTVETTTQEVHGRVIVGVDTHKYSHVAVAIDHLGPWKSIDDLEIAVSEYIDWYNTGACTARSGSSRPPSGKTPNTVSTPLRRPPKLQLRAATEPGARCGLGSRTRPLPSCQRRSSR